MGFFVEAAVDGFCNGTNQNDRRPYRLVMPSCPLMAPQPLSHHVDGSQPLFQPAFELAKK